MAALGSALSSQLRAPAPTAWKGKKQARAKRATPVRAASTENKIEEVAAAVDPKALLPKGLYCESHHQTIRRPTRCVASKKVPRAREIATRRASHPIFFFLARGNERGVVEWPSDPTLPSARPPSAGPSPSAMSSSAPSTPSSARP